MIDEKKLIEEIKYLLFNSEMLSPRWFAINEMLEIIKRQPEVGEWIPCSERLPEEEAKEFIKEHLNGIGYLYPCLLTYRSPNTEKINVVRFYYDLYQNWFVNLGEEPCEKDRCLAWQPLPEPWEEEKNDGRS